jgi:predicted ATPase
VITEIKINNFKSVADLTLQLGRFNVLIGANGSGKSNILEAIAFGGAASADKLDNEFLGSRGIRIASAQLMKSAFRTENFSQPIQLNFKNDDESGISFTVEEEDRPIIKWVILEKENIKETFRQLFGTIVGTEKSNILLSELNNDQKNTITTLSTTINYIFKDTDADKEFFLEKILSLIDYNIADKLYQDMNNNKNLSNFILYSPEISSLRKFEEESQIKPLGVKGEGLFSVLQIFYENESYGPETIDEIRKYLHIIEWFDDFEAIFDRVSGRKSLVVKDRNLPDVTLNQNNVNEGFLFLLFYISLIISKETPAFFAIDNIEASLHPLLCEELIKILVELSKKYNKQIILTTHNPFVLDGLDLTDPEQKLFVVRRNGDGETIADNIDKPVKNVKLSEAWMRGRIGGLPETI